MGLIWITLLSSWSYFTSMSANLLVHPISPFLYFPSNQLRCQPKPLFLAQVNRCLCLLSRNHGYTIHLYVLVLGCALCVMGLWQYSLCNVTFALATETLICVDVGKRIPIKNEVHKCAVWLIAMFFTENWDKYAARCDPMDQWTDRCTDRRTKPCLRQKMY